MALRKRRSVSLQLVILLPFVALSFLAVSLVGAVSFYNGRQAVNEVGRQLRQEINLRIAEHLHGFLRIPHLINQANAEAMQQGTLDPEDPQALALQFRQQVQVFETVTSINFGNIHGGLINAGREGADGSLYLIQTQDFRSGTFYKHGLDSRGNPTILLDSLPHFDARERSWYTEAVAQGREIWSDVYILFTGQDLSFSASRPVYGAGGELVGVTGVNLFMGHLSTFLTGLEVGKTGESFLMERSGLLLASSTGEQPFSTNGGTLERIAAAESTSPRTAGAARLVQESAASEHVFAIDGERQFVQVRPFDDGYGLDWLIVTVIPEHDFMEQISANNRATVVLMLFMAAAVTAVSIVMSRKIVRPISQLKEAAEQLADGRWRTNPSAGSSIEEIHALSGAFRRMAEQLEQTIDGLNHENAERRRAEAALEQLNRRLEAKNKELEQVVYVASHDLRSPLVNIDGYSREIAYLIDDIATLLGPEHPGLSKDLSEALGYIRGSVSHMDALLTGLLKLSRFGRAALHIEPVDAGKLLSEVLQSLEFRIREAGAEIEVSELPPCMADAVQLKQVFANLLENALKYLDPARPGRIRVSGEQREKRAVYCVEDNGIGIAPAHQAGVFEVFHQLEPSAAGDGLGLSIARQILTRLHGDVWVESNLGMGSRFYVALPLPETSLNQGAQQQ